MGAVSGDALIITQAGGYGPTHQTGTVSTASSPALYGYYGGSQYGQPFGMQSGGYGGSQMATSALPLWSSGWQGGMGGLFVMQSIITSRAVAMGRPSISLASMASSPAPVRHLGGSQYGQPFGMQSVIRRQPEPATRHHPMEQRMQQGR